MANTTFSGNELNDFEYERRFFCRHMPQELDDGDAPTLIIQSYYVHADNYALRVRLQSHTLRIDMSASSNPITILDTHRDAFSEAFVTVKGPSIGGTRYEAEREIDVHIGAELIKRGGSVIIKNRYSAWIGEDGWSIDVFGGANAPLIVAEAERSGPVTNLIIPSFCVTEITDQARFSNDGLAAKPFSSWAHDFDAKLASSGPHFEEVFGRNRME
jgi:CYTH domain-containing protein